MSELLDLSSPQTLTTPVPQMPPLPVFNPAVKHPDGYSIVPDGSVVNHPSHELLRAWSKHTWQQAMQPMRAALQKRLVTYTGIPVSVLDSLSDDEIRHVYNNPAKYMQSNSILARFLANDRLNPAIAQDDLPKLDFLTRLALGFEKGILEDELQTLGFKHGDPAKVKVYLQPDIRHIRDRLRTIDDMIGPKGAVAIAADVAGTIFGQQWASAPDTLATAGLFAGAGLAGVGLVSGGAAILPAVKPVLALALRGGVAGTTYVREKGQMIIELSEQIDPSGKHMDPVLRNRIATGYGFTAAVIEASIFGHLTALLGPKVGRRLALRSLVKSSTEKAIAKAAASKTFSSWVAQKGLGWGGGSLAELGQENLQELAQIGFGYLATEISDAVNNTQFDTTSKQLITQTIDRLTTLNKEFGPGIALLGGMGTGLSLVVKAPFAAGRAYRTQRNDHIRSLVNQTLHETTVGRESPEATRELLGMLALGNATAFIPGKAAAALLQDARIAPALGEVLNKKEVAAAAEGGWDVRVPEALLQTLEPEVYQKVMAVSRLDPGGMSRTELAGLSDQEIKEYLGRQNAGVKEKDVKLHKSIQGFRQALVKAGLPAEQVSAVTKLQIAMAHVSKDWEVDIASHLDRLRVRVENDPDAARQFLAANTVPAMTNPLFSFTLRDFTAAMKTGAFDAKSQTVLNLLKEADKIQRRMKALLKSKPVGYGTNNARNINAVIDENPDFKAQILAFEQKALDAGVGGTMLRNGRITPYELEHKTKAFPTAALVLAKLNKAGQVVEDNRPDKKKKGADFAAGTKDSMWFVVSSVEKGGKLKTWYASRRVEGERVGYKTRAEAEAALARIQAAGDMIQTDVPEYGSLGRTLTQTWFESMSPTARESFRSQLVAAIEKAYLAGELQKKGKGFAGNKELKSLGSGFAGVNARLLKLANKTWAALNLNTVCPMLTIGPHGCYMACYMVVGWAGPKVQTVYRRGVYTAELLQLSQADIDAINRAGGLRINGAGDWGDPLLEPQIRDIVRHARMRGLNLKVISKQKASWAILNRLAADPKIIDPANPHIQLQATLDPYWVDAAQDAGAMDTVWKDLVAQVDDPDLLQSAYQHYHLADRDVRIINGRLWRKYGLSEEQFESWMAEHPNLTDKIVTRRYVVGSPEDIFTITQRNLARGSKFILTWMHAKVPGGFYNDVVGRVLKAKEVSNYSNQMLIEKIDGRWQVLAAQGLAEARKLPEIEGLTGARFRKKLIELGMTSPRKHYAAVADYVYEHAADEAEADQIFKAMQQATCCEPNENEYTCTGCENPSCAAYKALAQKMAKVVETDNPAMPAALDAVGRDAGAGLALMQLEAQGLPRGAFHMEDLQYVITLFHGADVSTLTHEMAHLWFQIFTEERSTNQNPELQRWLDDAGKWLGVQEGQTALTREQQETFAEHFTAYLRTGVAPSTALQNVFARFAAWLTRIYAQIETIWQQGDRPVEVTDEVRSIFDRLLASERQVEQSGLVREMLAVPEQTLVGLNADEKKRLADFASVAQEQWRAAVQASTLKLKARSEKRWRKEAVEQVNNDPVYKKLTEFRKNKASRLNREAIIRILGRDFYDSHRKLLDPLTVTLGVNPGRVAAELGLPDEVALIDELLSAPSKEARVQQILDEKAQEFDDLVDVDAHITEAEAAAEYFTAMERLLQEKIGPDKARAGRAAIKAQVAQSMEAMPLKEAIRVSTFVDELRRMVLQRDRALAKGDFETALTTVGDLRRQFDRIKIAVALREEFHKLTQKTIPDLLKAKPGFIDEQYAVHAKFLAYRFGLSDTMPNLDMRKQVLSALLAQGLEGAVDEDHQAAIDTFANVPYIWPEHLLDETRSVPYKELSVEDARDLANLLQHLVGRGRDIVRARDRFAKDSIAALAERTAQSMARLPDAPIYGSRTAGGRRGKWWARLFAELDNLHSIFLRADAFQGIQPTKEDHGDNVSLLYHSLADASERKLLLSGRVEARIRPFFDVLERKRQSMPDSVAPDIPIPERLRKRGDTYWTFDHVVAMALNFGNSYNKNALFAGYPDLTEAQVNELFLRVLGPAEWKAVQGIWDGINTLWPDMADTFRRVYYFTPTKVAAEELTTPDGTVLAGGYYPVKFDPKSRDAKPGQADAAQLTADLVNQAFPSTATKKGMTIQRTGTGGRPLHLSASAVLPQHIQSVTDLITMTIPVREVHRVTSHKTWKDMAIRKLGVEAYDSIRPLLSNMARGTNRVNTAVDSLINIHRAKAVLHILGFNMVVSAKQLLSIADFAQDYGFSAYVRGLALLANGGMGAVAEVQRLSSYMNQRSALIDRDVNFQIHDWAQTRSWTKENIRKLQAIMYLPIKLADLLATVPMWMSVYERAAKTMDQSSAVREANEAIAKSQPSSRALDLSNMQISESTAVRLFTMFSSFTIRWGQRQRSFYRAYKAGSVDTAEYVHHTLYEWVAPIMVMNAVPLLIALLSDDDEEDDKAAGHKLLADMVLYPFAGYPFVRDIARGVAGAVLPGQRNYDRTIGSPAFTVLQEVYGTLSGAAGVFSDRDDRYEELAYSIIRMVSYSLGLPFHRVYKSVKDFSEEE